LNEAEWRFAVHRLLRSGYGAEDIAVKLTKQKVNTHAVMVRAEIRRLRMEGSLMRVLGLDRKEGSGGIREDERSGDHQPPQQTETGDPI